MGVCERGNPVWLVSSFLSEIKVKWVIYHEGCVTGTVPSVRVCVGGAHTQICSHSQGVWCQRVCVCVCPAAACVRGGHLSFACAMINGLHRAVQPCMFLGLSFYAVSN